MTQPWQLPSILHLLAPSAPLQQQKSYRVESQNQKRAPIVPSPSCRSRERRSASSRCHHHYREHLQCTAPAAFLQPPSCRSSAATIFALQQRLHPCEPSLFIGAAPC
ncbi:hypothetical protein DEO72_LG9g1867 [Vigna unguiculata]|uniref:Uncharacterized protein n=1 Tax=Vigna unguiculata TaxID=3917 RepID=A0A4D6MZB6_VIGUN|nr:hypothetical protein DEO72_LG9g1867 [Vigna unguiculata]